MVFQSRAKLFDAWPFIDLARHPQTCDGVQIRRKLGRNFRYTTDLFRIIDFQGAAREWVQATE